MQIRIIKPKTFVQFGLLVMVLKVSCDISNILPYSDFLDLMLSLVAVGFMMLEILHQSYTGKKILLYAVLTVFSGISVILTGNYGFLISIITCMAICKMDLNRVIRFIFQYELIFLSIHTLLSIVLFAFGKGEIYHVIRQEMRFSFGFIHPNSLAIYVFNLICMWMWLNYETMTKKKAHELVLISFGIFFLTRTRTMFIMTLMLLALFYLAKVRRIRTSIPVIAQFSVPVAAGVSLLLVQLYLKGSNIAYAADKFLTGRVKLGAYAGYHMNVTWLGQSIERLQNIHWDSFWKLNLFTFDNLYTCLTYNQGVIWIFVFSLAFYLIAKRGDIKECILVILWAAYGITEVNGLNAFLFFPLLLTSRLFDKGREKQAYEEGKYYNSCV